MKILAFDAALGGFSAAVDDGSELHVAASDRPDALERGLYCIEALLAQAGLRLDELDRIAVGLGPGSFTGVRIAVAFAKSLSYGSGVPLVGVSSYDALEPGDVALPALTVVHGRRGVICARRRDPGASQAACGPVAEVLDRLLHGKPATLDVSGNTEDVIAQIDERGWTVRAHPPRASVAAVAIAQLARVRAPSASAHALAPDYGEAPAVTRPAAS